MDNALAMIKGLVTSLTSILVAVVGLGVVAGVVFGESWFFGVQVMAYELRMASQAPVPQAAESVVIPAVTVEKMEGLFAHLQQALQDIGFIHSEQDGKMMQKLRRFFHRACPDEKEINILRGMLSAAQGAKSMRSDASKKHS